jgi:cyclophilin family peptidyl-prolyl cis-trans isomerase
MNNDDEASCPTGGFRFFRCTRQPWKGKEMIRSVFDNSIFCIFKKSLFMKSLLPVLFLLLFFSCGKKEAIVITPENLNTVLTRYGSENPETEVTIETDYGTIKLRLYDDVPLHRANFIKLIKDGYYDNADFYRVEKEFMIQGGDLNKKLNYRIPSEFNQKYFHKRGALSMARTDDNNPKRESSAAEFFIVQGERYADWDIDQQAKDNGLTLTPEQRQTYLTQGGYMSLDQQYTVFGEVVEGIDVVDKIAGVKVYNTDKPVKKIPFSISVHKAE